MGARGTGVALAGALAIAASGTAAAGVRTFEPEPRSQALYAVGADTEVRDLDGVHVETWLPAARDGHVPPERLPTVLVYSPYETAGEVSAPYREIRDVLVTHGYAFTVAHTPGSGSSRGCEVLGGRAEQAAGARVIEYLGERARWASGHVGMYGGSASAGSALNVAASADRGRVETLDAIVPYAPTASRYDFFHHDGVPHLLQAPASTAYDYVNNGVVTGRPGLAADPAGRVKCQPREIGSEALADGDYDPHYAEFDRHLDVGRITAATLMVHGHADRRVSSLTQAGLFGRLPVTTPRRGIFTSVTHAGPLTEQRGDWNAIVLAWFDTWLKGLDAGVEDWPAVQVEGTSGTWRAQRRWPQAAGRAGQLALGGGGVLGTTAPGGSTGFVESAIEVDRERYAYPPGTAAMFQTAPLPAPLELIGVPVLDAWVTLDRPDAHVAVKLEALGPDGVPTAADATTIGARSARHLDPMPGDHFTQAEGRAPATGVPVRIPIRLNPTDLVVPAGGRLRLTIAGSVIAYDGLDGAMKGLGDPLYGPTMPSGTATRVSVLHDCAHPTILRFVTPRPRDDVLAVAGKQPEAPTAVDGGGIAHSTVCGRRPQRPARATR